LRKECCDVRVGWLEYQLPHMLRSWIGGIGESLQNGALDRKFPAQSHSAKYHPLRERSTKFAAGSKSHERIVIFIVKLLDVSGEQRVSEKEHVPEQ
jgi:hypothetical protein